MLLSDAARAYLDEENKRAGPITSPPQKVGEELPWLMAAAHFHLAPDQDELQKDFERTRNGLTNTLDALHGAATTNRLQEVEADHERLLKIRDRVEAAYRLTVAHFQEQPSQTADVVGMNTRSFLSR